MSPELTSPPVKHNNWWNFAHVVANLAPLGVVIYATAAGNKAQLQTAVNISNLTSSILNQLTNQPNNVTQTVAGQ